MSTMRPTVGIIKNIKDDLYHPILFTEYPLPGQDSPDKPRRFKSKMHHMGGFDTRDAAVENISDLASKVNNSGKFIGSVVYLKSIGDPEKDIEWDGEGTPAITMLFSEDMLSDEYPIIAA